MTLGDKRRKFTEALALLTLFALYHEGWKLAGDQLMRCRECEVGDADSVHKLGLAEDMNLYIDGHYITDGTGHDVLHDFWDMLGGAPRIEEDMNHYSFEHGGKW